MVEQEEGQVDDELIVCGMMLRLGALSLSGWASMDSESPLAACPSCASVECVCRNAVVAMSIQHNTQKGETDFW